MPIRFDRFKPDRKGVELFLHSGDLDDALTHAGNDVIELAKPGIGLGQEDWFNDRGPDRKIRKYLRETRNVGNNHPAAAAREFGSGHRGEGRPQGGSNEPTRALGKAGARIGDFHGNGPA